MNIFEEDGAEFEDECRAFELREKAEELRQEGRDAFKAGTKVEDCPHERDYYASLWREGWFQMRNERDADWEAYNKARALHAKKYCPPWMDGRARDNFQEHRQKTITRLEEKWDYFAQSFERSGRG